MKDFVPLMQTALWICLIVFAVLLFRRALMDRLERGGALKIGPIEFGQLAEKVDNVTERVDELAGRVSELFLLTMSTPMYRNLEKIASGSFGNYVLDDALKRELYHLRDIGYIEVQAIREIPYQGEELSSHVTATVAGRRFVELRTWMVSRPAAAAGPVRPQRPSASPPPADVQQPGR